MGINIAVLLILAGMMLVFTLSAWASRFSNTVVSLTMSEAVDREGDQARTELTLLSAEGGGSTLSLQVKNTGLTSIYDYAGMDFIVDYTDTSNNKVFTYLTYTTGTLGNNQWKKTSISPDSFQPNGWDPDETITLDAILSPAQKDDTSATVAVVSPNGVAAASSFSSKGFFWFTNAFDISLIITGSWQDIDLSDYVPKGASGAIVELVHTGSSVAYSGVVRGKEDTRDYMSNANFEEIEQETHRWQIVKIDSNLLIQGYIENTEIDFNLRGYTSGSDPTYFKVPPAITPTTAGSWTAVDVSALVEDDTDGVILLVDSQRGPSSDYAVREVGSSFNTTNRGMEGYGNTMYLVGIDANDQFEVYIQTTEITVFLVGQTKGSVVYYTDDIVVGDPSTGSWQEVDADDSGIPDEANGLIFWVENTGSQDHKGGVRHGDSTDDWNADVGGRTHLQAATGIRSDNVWDEYLEDTQLDVYIAAYTTPLTN